MHDVHDRLARHKELRPGGSPTLMNVSSLDNDSIIRHCDAQPQPQLSHR